MHKRLWMTVAALVFITVLAAGFRFYKIQHYPGGLHPDEAANGLDVLSILHGDIKPFYDRNNGREGLFFLLQAVVVKVMGVGVTPMHVAAGIVGVLTVLATYFAVRPWFGRLAGVVAALFLATNQWHVTLSRTGFRAIMIPLFIALTTACTGYAMQSYRRGQKKRAYLFAALAGIAFGGGFYTYIAYRAMLAVALGVLFVMLLSDVRGLFGPRSTGVFPHVRRYWGMIVMGLLFTVLAVTPLGLYFVRHPDAFVGRASQVSIFNKDLQVHGSIPLTVLDVTRKTMLSFFWRGDTNWRQNVSGYSMLNPLVGLFFLLGFVWLIKGLWEVLVKLVRGKELHYSLFYVYLFLLLTGMMLPVITTAEGIPHGLRSLGMLFSIFCLAGVAAAVFIHWVQRWAGEQRKAIVLGALAGIAFVGVAYDATLYFLFAPNSIDAAMAYRSDLTPVAAFITDYDKQHSDKPLPYLVLDGYSQMTTQYLTDSVADTDETQHYRLVDPATAEKTRLQPGEIIVFTLSTMPDAERYAKIYQGQLKLVTTLKNKFNEEILRVYEYQGAATPDAAASSLDA